MCNLYIYLFIYFYKSYIIFPCGHVRPLVGGLVFDHRSVHVGFVAYKAAVILTSSHRIIKVFAELRIKKVPGEWPVLFESLLNGCELRKNNNDNKLRNNKCEFGFLLIIYEFQMTLKYGDKQVLWGHEPRWLCEMPLESLVSLTEPQDTCSLSGPQIVNKFFEVMNLDGYVKGH
jgi:hypothetical protein